ncbi:hypothetical protein ACMYSN_04340 [Klebsiella sp. R445]
MINYLGTIMSTSVAVTVLTGVAVFVAGQLIAKRVIEPYVSFKEQLGRISALLLREQAKITSFNADAVTIHDLKDAAAQLIAKYSALSCFLKKSYIGMRCVPTPVEVLESARNLNMIVSVLVGGSREGLSKLIEEIGQNLKIPTTYTPHFLS